MFGFCKSQVGGTQYPNAITSTYTAFWNNVRDGYILQAPGQRIILNVGQDQTINSYIR